MKTNIPHPPVHTKSQLLPELTLAFRKHKKYNRPRHNKENSIQNDIDDIIVDLVPRVPCLQKIVRHQQVQFQQKMKFAWEKVSKGEAAVCPPLAKGLRSDIEKYIDKLGQPHRDGEGDYAEFLRLSRESQDYLEYYIKNHFKENELNQDLKCRDKAVILSLLKNHYRCLTDNPPEVSHRILLSFNINPLNDFHYVPWTVFAKFRKLATLKHTKSQARKFLVSYLMGSKREITVVEFWSLIGAVLRKL